MKSQLKPLTQPQGKRLKTPKHINALLVTVLIGSFAQLCSSQSLAGSSNSANTSSGPANSTEKDKIIAKSVVPIDKGCVTASLYVRTQLLEKQNNKFNLLTAIDEIKASQMAFIQKSTLTAYFVYVDAIESTDVNPPLMASQYMLNCLSFVRH